MKQLTQRKSWEINFRRHVPLSWETPLRQEGRRNIKFVMSDVGGAAICHV
jgi:hypothetical protein